MLGAAWNGLAVGKGGGLYFWRRAGRRAVRRVFRGVGAETEPARLLLMLPSLRMEEGGGSLGLLRVAWDDGWDSESERMALKS